MLLETLNRLYDEVQTEVMRDGRVAMAIGRVSLVGAGPGDPELWTVRACSASRRPIWCSTTRWSMPRRFGGLTNAQCFCVGKRAGRASVRQETINRLMIRAARQGKRVVRLKGGDPFVFGRGAEEALALASAGIPLRSRAWRDDGRCGAGAGRHSGDAPRRGVGLSGDGRPHGRDVRRDARTPCGRTA